MTCHHIDYLVARKLALELRFQVLVQYYSVLRLSENFEPKISLLAIMSTKSLLKRVISMLGRQFPI